MVERRGTFFRNSSYIYLFLMAESFTMWLKVFQSRPQSKLSVFAMIVAAHGALYNKASSPKASPGL